MRDHCTKVRKIHSSARGHLTLSLRSASLAGTVEKEREREKDREGEEMLQQASPGAK